MMEVQLEEQDRQAIEIIIILSKQTAACESALTDLWIFFMSWTQGVWWYPPYLLY